MRYRDSLRFRILVSFVVIGAILGPLVAATLLWATHLLEERAVVRLAAERLQEVIRAPDDFVLREIGPSAGVKVLTSLNTRGIPGDILELPDGVHEYHRGDDVWVVALATAAEGRYAVVTDVTALDQREELIVLTVGLGSFLAVCIALWLGFYMARRLLAPLRELSFWAAKARTSAESVDRVPLQKFPDDEVGTLARALDHYARRMSDLLLREREFSANVSHELRNPLAIIQNAAELIEVDTGASARTRNAASRIVSAAQRLNETISVLMMLARDPGEIQSDEEVSVAERVATLVREHTGRHSSGQAQVHHSLEAMPMLDVPPVVVEVIIGNLIRNAQQHAGACRIDVLVLQDRVSVSDDGAGIPEEELPYVCERGMRGSNAGGDGRGLGLAMVAYLCRRFGWRLELASRVCQGTQADWIFYPADPPARASEQRRRASVACTGAPQGL